MSRSETSPQAITAPGSPPVDKGCVDPTPRVLAEAFTGEIKRNEVSCAYKLGLALVAGGMVLVTAVYVALVCLSAFGVYYHLSHDRAVLGSGGLGGVIAYFGPALMGCTVVFFMVKPYFAGEPERPPKYSVTTQSDPALLAFITRICELVKAPIPCRVDVDCQVNASASFASGLKSLGKNEVVLTIGLPLAAGLTLQEFAGVLAHELGHFSQRAGMRLTYIIRATNGWFARVVYERDEWDVRLARAAASIDIRIGVLLHLSRLAVWLSRRVLWVLMHMGHAISCFMLRQMEYDADSYETKLAGSNAFASTVNKLQRLLAASRWANREMAESWRNRRLPENLPSFISLSVNNVSGDSLQAVEGAQNRRRIFATHPSDTDRVKAARALNQPGIFHLTGPASSLFSDFAELSAAATRFHYEHNLGLKFSAHNLVAHDTLTMESQSRAEAEKSLRDFFLGLRFPFRPIRIAEEPGDCSMAGLMEGLKRAKQAMEESKPEVQKALAQYEYAEALYQRGLSALMQQTQQATSKATAALQEATPTLERFERAAQTRLVCALHLLCEAEVAGKIEGGASLQKEMEQIAPAFAHLGQAWTQLHELQRRFGPFEATLQARREPKLAARAEQRLNEFKPELERLIKQVQDCIKGVRYPFHHPREDITIDAFARSDIAASNKLQALYNECSCHLNRLLPLWQRLLGRLTFMTIRVEEHVLPKEQKQD